MATTQCVVSTLKKRAEFLRVRGGARLETRAFVLEGKPRAPEAEPDAGAGAAAAPSAGPTCRFGFTITKRLGNAVVRNRIRRRLREAVRRVAPVAARPGYDYVLVVRGAALTRDFADLCRDLETALARVNRMPIDQPRKRRGAGPVS